MKGFVFLCYQIKVRQVAPFTSSTKTSVVNIGGTPSYFHLHLSTNEKSTTVRLLNFLANFFTIDMKLQHLCNN